MAFRRPTSLFIWGFVVTSMVVSALSVDFICGVTQWPECSPFGRQSAPGHLGPGGTMFQYGYANLWIAFVIKAHLSIF
ncbi:hypothetical protein BJY01DRAFT_204046 [Aspergillus pseudoustus]|uniref:Transmembrane protein n=1 Tax=Aspergillus pseudoustus TaxID=1810923 RepID=A0ABR4KUF7_9EURO